MGEEEEEERRKEREKKKAIEMAKAIAEAEAKAKEEEEEKRKAQEKARKEKEEEEEKERLSLKEKRDTLLVDLGRLEVSINEKENLFAHYVKNQMESGDPNFLLGLIERMVTEVDFLVRQLETEIDLTLLWNKMRSYAEEVNQNRQTLSTRCEVLKKEIKKAIDSLKEKKKRKEEEEEEERKKVQEEEQKRVEEEKEKKKKRSSGYTAHFTSEEELHFSEQDTNIY